MSDEDSADEEPRQVNIRTGGGSSTGLIIGGIVVLGIAGVVGYYLYTGWQTEQDYVNAVKDYQNCIEKALDEGRTVEEAQTICWGYKQAVDDLGGSMAHGFGYWFDIAIKDLASLGIVFAGAVVTISASVIGYKIISRWLKNHPGSGGSGGTPTEPFHDFNDNTNWSYSTDFVNHCLFDYGTPHYDNPSLNSIWNGVRAMPEWEKELIIGFMEDQGIPDTRSFLQQGWDGLPTEAKIALVGVLIAGLLIICTVSLGAATPEALPLAAMAIAAV